MGKPTSFARRLTLWQRRHGRRGLPWQETTDPYRIWLSEVMLQQTQVAAVIPYYQRFLQRFPDVAALAAASQDEVLRHWSGLGYYARGRNLHRAAQRIQYELQGEFPRSARQIGELPGIGRSTAAAVAAFAFGERAAILDGNVKRVLARWGGIEGWPGATAVATRLWSLAESLLPHRGIQTYTQALMDLGATLCTRAKPRCEECPVRDDCVARRMGLVDEIPAPRPARALPQREATWLLLTFGGEILLERRPPAGLWGGLWTFPESAGGDIGSHCERALGCEIASQRSLEPLEHGFTHFRLRIHPVVCVVRRVHARAGQHGRRWLRVEQARAAAVPTPVKKLLGMNLGAPGGRARRTSRAAPA